MSTSLDALLAALHARGHKGIRFGLSRVRAVLEHLGVDPDGTPAIVVAGTNGKGSVSAMIEAVARRAGHRTGLYTSPHLERIHERIRLDGEPIDDDAFTEALRRVFSADAGPVAGEMSFFETLTVAAFVAFAQTPRDLVVLEVGLGGRLDATNVVRRPLATAVVTITEGRDGRDLEHADWLGADVRTIAREKAGVAKSGAPLVIGVVGEDAFGAIVEEAASRGSEPIWAVDPPGDAPIVSAIRRDGERVIFPDGSRYVLQPGLAGTHQQHNAVVAAATAHLAERSGLALRAAIEVGIAEAVWPGRLERFEVARGVTLLLDCAHNIEGARALAVFCRGALQPDQTVLLFGALSDKQYEACLEILAPLAHRRVFSPLDVAVRAAVSPQLLADRVGGIAAADVADALRRALEDASPGDTVLVTGSIYLVGAVRALIRGTRATGSIGL